jgi:hypothetical protein
VYREYSVTGDFTEKHKAEIVRLSRNEVYRMTVGDPSMKGDGKFVSTNGKTPWEIFNRHDDGLGSFFMVEANRARVQGWQALQNAFGYELESGEQLYDIDANGYPILKFTRRPKLFIFRSCQYTWDSLTNVIHDDVNIEDVKKTKSYYEPGQGDDEAECVRYGYLAINPTAMPRAQRSENQSEGLMQAFKRKMLRKSSPYARF